MAAASEFNYRGAEIGCAHAYLLPALKGVLCDELRPGERIFDLGCGNGSVAAALTASGYRLTGVDPSISGIEHANRAYPSIPLHVGSGYDPLEERFGTFPALISLEVIEHVYAPRDFIQTAFRLLQPGGLIVLSTPYHGYLKNVALALSGKLDNHFTALWDHGHIKFWSERTLRILLQEARFQRVSFLHAGRIPWLAKSMLAVAQRPLG